MFKNSKKFTLLFFLLLTFTQKSCQAHIELINALTALKTKLLSLQKKLQELKQDQVMHPSGIWAQLKASDKKKLPASEKFNLFYHDCDTFAKTENSKIPQHDPSQDKILRIVTFNVFKMTKGVEAIKQVITTLNPDIIILEEAFNLNSRFGPEENKLNDYDSLHFGLFGGYLGDQFGNTLLWKKNLKLAKPIEALKYQNPSRGEPRAYIKALFNLSSGKQLLFYGTHLDIHDKTDDVRTKEVQEVIDDVKTSNIPNIIYAGDFNAVREKDYDNATWLLAEQEYLAFANKPGAPKVEKMPTQALKHLMDNGFEDCFTITNPTAKFPGPQFTVWTGTVVDFIFLKKDTWNLPIAGCYVYYSAASDHLPIIMDIDLS